PLERVERVWRGIVMDTYALEQLTGWTPDLAPAPDTPLFRWRVLADNTQLLAIAATTNDRDKRRDLGDARNVYSDRRSGAIGLAARAAGQGRRLS
ncbi:MAG TPA: hypothetical protein VL899_14510, partial [Alphaproteobacteria bacterium]|nr:hypothetical protein [Alphaproteobacteria bacterium]